MCGDCFLHRARPLGGTEIHSIVCRSSSRAMFWPSNFAMGVLFRDGRSIEHVKVTPGQVDWDEPSNTTHRAVNVGDVPYEEITVFLLTHADDVPQPDA